MFSSKLLISAYSRYVVNNEHNYKLQGEQIKEQPGNETWYGGRISRQLLENLALGLDVDIISAEASIINDQKDPYTEITLVFLSPLIGYQLDFNQLKLNFNIAYLNNTDGKNVFESDGFNVGITVIL